MTEEMKKGEIEPPLNAPLRRSDDFVSVLSSRFSAGYTDDRVFFVDFRKPDLRSVGTEDGDIEMEGEQVSVAQVTLPPKAAKELAKILSDQVEAFEEMFGEIETGDKVSEDDEE